MQPSDVTVAILVGGQARRLDGRVKGTLHVGGVTILDRQLAAVREAEFDHVVLVGRWNAPLPPGIQHAPDVITERGALGGLYSALLVAPTPIVVVLAGDLPFVTARLLSRLASMGDEHDAAIPRVDGKWHPLCAAYRRRVATRVKARLDRGELRVTDALADMCVREISAEELLEWNADDMLLMNVNTPDDHRRADSHPRARS